MNGQAAVFEEARETHALVTRVPNAGGDRRVVEHRAELRRRTTRRNESTIGFERFWRIASFFLRGESASVRSMRKSMPMRVERGLRALRIGGQRLEEVPAGSAPSS